jgi:hypothetical protein
MQVKIGKRIYDSTKQMIALSFDKDEIRMIKQLQYSGRICFGPEKTADQECKFMNDPNFAEVLLNRRSKAK